MKLIPYSINTGEINMKTDEKLLDKAISEVENDAIFRLYGWSPACISLGRNQNNGFLDNDLLNKYNIDTVRRLTGGRALLHDNELTYSFISSTDYLKKGESVIESYKEISQILIDIFKEVGIELTLGGGKHVNTRFDYCMLISTGADLCWKNRKFIGSAQCRKNGYILQHGSILLDYNRELLQSIFKEEVNTDSIVSLKEINPNIEINDIINIANKMFS